MMLEGGHPHTMVHRKMPDPLQAKAIELIRQIRRRTGLSVTDIARHAGLSPSTLTRAYPEPKVNYTLSSRTLAKLEAKFPERGLIESASPPTNGVSPALAEHLQPTFPVFGLERYQIPHDWRSQIPQGLILDHEHTVELWRDFHTASTTTMPFLLGSEGEKERLIGVHVAGDAMDPRLKAGEIAVIDKIKPVPLLADTLVRIEFPQNEVGILIAQIIKRDTASMYFSFAGDPSNVFTLPRDKILDIFPIVAIITNSY